MTGSLEQPGLTPRAVSELFSSIGNMKDSTVTVRSYFVELYNDQLVDLYSKLVRGEDYQDSRFKPPKLDIKV